MQPQTFKTTGMIISLDQVGHVQKLLEAFVAISGGAGLRCGYELA